jgi:hypothetical protein
MNLHTEALNISGIVKLTNLGVIRAFGEEADKFLQGQLTQDVVDMGLNQARLAAFCNPKGRMQASFVVLKQSREEILLICSQDLIGMTVKRLSMFVMRAKVKLTDATDDFALYGVAGSAIQSFTDMTSSPCTKVDSETGSLAFLYPGAGCPRAIWYAPAGSPAPEGERLDLETWNWLEVQSGVAMVTRPIFEAFVPQMLNYESVDGVNFKKGCYPGQEIVARSQFRGTLKRRAYLAHADTALEIGQEVFHVHDADQPCGIIAAAAPSPAGGFDAIVSMQTSAATDALVHISKQQLTAGKSSSVTLTLLPLLALPYLLREDI